MTGARPLSQKEIALFFFPLLLNVQLMSVSHSVINAFLARQEDYVTALAAFSVAMIVHLFIASPAYQNHTVTIAMVLGRRSTRGTIGFVLLVAGYVSTILMVLAYTPVGAWALLLCLGIDGVVADQARHALGLLAFLPFITGFRGFFQGLVMQQRRTALVSFASGVRVGALLVLLIVGRHWFAGVTLGAFGLLGCVAVETAVMAWFALRLPPLTLPPPEHEPGFGEIVRFGFPLAYASGLQQAVPILISAILGRLPDATIALAAFGVLRGLLFLLASPLRNLQQAYLTLARGPEDYQAMVRFHRRIGGTLAVLLVLVAFPLRNPILSGLLGLDPAMCAYLALPLAFSALYPLLYGASTVLRGYFTERRRTFELGRSTVYKVLFLLACWGLLLAVPVTFPGIAVAVFLMVASEACEAGYLRQRRLTLLASAGGPV